MSFFLNNQPLKVSLWPENPFIKFSDVLLEIGTVVSLDEFFVAWRGRLKGVDFLLDPFDGTCKFCFTRDYCLLIQRFGQAFSDKL